VSYWHRGSKPVTPALPTHQKRAALSYLQLVEIAFVAVMRNLGISLQRIRQAREYLATAFQEEYPFAAYEFKTDGHHVLMELDQVEGKDGGGKLIVADRHGQLAWKELLYQRFTEFEYEDNVAIRWHPAGPTSPVVIDPTIAFGAPVIRGIPTWALRGRWKAGETLGDIAEDFQLDRKEVITALEFEGIKAAA
jgi:uncharacterized protein (DUF433 family)